MKTLSRYLLSQNLFLILVCLVLGVMIYLLSDVFDRLDDFLEAGLGPGVVLTYFGVKIPLILSQIMPAVFLIALIVQISIMRRNREILALQAGGVPYLRMVAFFVAYAVVWSFLQLGFSQFFGVTGLEKSSRIWSEQVRGREKTRDTVHDVWFRQGDVVVHFQEASPSRGRGSELSAYRLAQDGRSLEWIVTAPAFRTGTDEWTLVNAEKLVPGSFEITNRPTLDLQMDQELSAFAAAAPRRNPASLPLWRLGRAINTLEQGGSNVEGLRTAWHAKWSYAFSILVMALVALSVASFGLNIYLNVAVSLVVTFAFYGFYVIGTTMGEKGLLPPMLGAWLGNAVFMLAAASRLVWYNSRR